MINCRYFEACSAPLCPQLSKTMLKALFWFSDEDVCKNKKVTVDWLERQRELKKKHRNGTFVRFSYEHLECG